MTRPIPTARSAYPWSLPIQTRWLDNDVYGHMNNTVHYTLFDTAANAWLISAGLLDPLNGETIGVMVSSGCTYHSEMGYPDIIDVGVRVSRIGGSSVTYEFGCFRNGADVSSADGTFTHVYVDKAERRPQALTDAWRAKLSEILAV